MRLVPYDRKKIKRFYKMSDNYQILKEFAESDHDCMKVEGWTCKTAGYCATSLNGSIKRYKINGMFAVSRKGEVFLIKTEK